MGQAAPGSLEPGPGQLRSKPKSGKPSTDQNIISQLQFPFPARGAMSPISDCRFDPVNVELFTHLAVWLLASLSPGSYLYLTVARPLLCLLFLMGLCSWECLSQTQLNYPFIMRSLSNFVWFLKVNRAVMIFSDSGSQTPMRFCAEI